MKEMYPSSPVRLRGVVCSYAQGQLYLTPPQERYFTTLNFRLSVTQLGRFTKFRIGSYAKSLLGIVNLCTVTDCPNDVHLVEIMFCSVYKT